MGTTHKDNLQLEENVILDRDGRNLISQNEIRKKRRKGGNWRKRGKKKRGKKGKQERKKDKWGREVEGKKGE